MMIAPVSVARSMMPAGLNRSCVYQSTSHRTKRPSASVLMTSIVSPFIDVTTSPGRTALPDGMFSTSPTRPTTLALALRSARARMVPATTPAPPMSMVMSSMPPAGFSEIPPVSNTTPLPTKASGASSASPPFQFMTTTLEGLSDPCPTHSNDPMPSFSSAASSSTSTSSPSADISSRRLANSVVVKTLAGSLTRSRVMCTPSATASIGAAAASVSSGLATATRYSPAALSSSAVLCTLNS